MEPPHTSRYRVSPPQAPHAPLSHSPPQVEPPSDSTAKVSFACSGILGRWNQTFGYPFTSGFCYSIAYL